MFITDNLFDTIAKIILGDEVCFILFILCQSIKMTLNVLSQWNTLSKMRKSLSASGVSLSLLKLSVYNTANAWLNWVFVKLPFIEQSLNESLICFKI